MLPVAAQESPGLVFLPPEEGWVDLTVSAGEESAALVDLAGWRQGVAQRRTTRFRVDLALPLPDRRRLEVSLVHRLKSETEEGVDLSGASPAPWQAGERVAGTGPLRVGLEAPAGPARLAAGLWLAGEGGALGIDMSWRGRWVWDPIALSLELRRDFPLAGGGGGTGGTAGALGVDFAVNERVALGGGLQVGVREGALATAGLLAVTVGLGRERWLTVGAAESGKSLFLRLGAAL